MTRIETRWLAVLLLVLMAALIIPGLNDNGLWIDEGYTTRFTNEDSPREVLQWVIDDRHPPLYFETFWAWRQVAGSSEVSLRLLSTFATLIAGACLFQWSKSLFGSATGLAALLIFALVDKQVDFSREMRHYTWLMMWNAASSWMLVRWLQGKSSGLPYVLTVIGGLYTHTFFFMILLVQGIYALVVLRFSRRFGKLVMLWALAGLAFLPWALVFLYQYTVLGSIHHTLPLTWEILRLLVPEYLGRPVVLFAGLIVLAVLFARRENVLMPFLGVFVPLAVIFGLMTLSSDLEFFTERNMSIIIPPLAVLIGVGVTRFEGFARGALVLFLLVNGIFTTDSHQLLYEDGRYITAPRQQNPPWRELIRKVEERQIDEQPVLSEVGSDTMVVDYHLQRIIGEDVEHVSVYELTLEKDKLDPLTALRFQHLEGVEGLWYLYWGSDTTFLDALVSWGYIRTATYETEHFGNPIHAFRYDSTALMNESRAVYGDEMILHRVYSETDGEKLRVSLWWSARQPMQQNYTVSVFLLNSAGQVVSQHDSLPQDNQSFTSTWTPGTLYYDFHALPVDLPAGEYQLAVKVYSGGTILFTESGEEFFLPGKIHLD